MENNVIQHHFQKLLFAGKITIFEDLNTKVYYIAYHDERSSTIFPMVNINGNYITSTNLENYDFHFSKLLVEDESSIYLEKKKKKIVYYLEEATGIIYIQHTDLVSSSITPLINPDGSYFTYSQWKNIHNI